jgi:exosome complex RNA-binding protein Rrp42 (RNase PH superfamily)
MAILQGHRRGRHVHDTQRIEIERDCSREGSIRMLGGCTRDHARIMVPISTPQPAR